VTIDFFAGNGICNGVPTQNSGNIALVGGSVDATAFNFTVNSSGDRSFLAHYTGDGNYNASDGPCEFLPVTLIASTTTTSIHNAAHAVVTSVPTGTTVHDSVTVPAGAAGTPTGNVTVD